VLIAFILPGWLFIAAFNTRHEFLPGGGISTFLCLPGDGGGSGGGGGGGPGLRWAGRWWGPAVIAASYLIHLFGSILMFIEPQSAHVVSINQTPPPFHADKPYGL
jgi:hypothetical protein